MSKTIDERVVEMRFDNQQFERNVKTTMSTLDKLKQSLNLTGAAKGLEGIEKSANRCDLSGLSNAVQSVGSKFSALEVMAITALANITNSAVNAGKRIISALTIDPIKTGFNEYELKMGSIQTIMASTGESLESVNKYLAELNEYSDRTIYSFADMTSNIGKFTNAGVKLDDAVAAIKGVSNVAAVSGANANEASRAMYNFAQALSAGYIKLIDWKSIENANMATVEFKKYLLEAAVAEGTLKKTTDGMYKTIGKGTVIDATHNFNDSLQEQWMTTEALVSTLKDYADETTEIGKKAYSSAQDVKTFSQLFDTLKEAAQSGWASTWETIVGDFEESKALLTDINDVVSGMIGKSAELRNTMLEGWKDAGGRTAVIDAFRNAFKGLESIVVPIQEAFREIFPRTTSKQLVAFSNGLKTLTEKMKVSDETAGKIKSTFKGLFAFLHVGVKAFSAIAKGAKDLVTFLLPASKGLLTMTGSIGDWVVGADEATSKSDIFTKTFERIKDILSTVAEKVQTSIGKIVDSVDDFVESADPLKKMGEVTSKVIKTLGDVLKKAGPFFSEFGSTLGKAFNSGGFAGVLNLINGGALAALIMGLKSLVGSFRDISDSAGGFVKGITDILGGVKDSLKAFQSELNSKMLMNIAAAIGILAVSLAILAAIDPSKLGGALIGITTLFADLMVSLTMLSKTVGSAKFKSIIKVISAMIGLSVAVLLLSVAMAKLAETDWGGLTKGLIGVASLSVILIEVSKKLAVSSSDLIKASGGLIVFGLAIRILASSVIALGKMDTLQLLQGLLSVAALCAGLALFLNHTYLSDMGIKTGLGIMAMAIGIGVLAHAVKTLAGIDEDKLVLGLTSLGLILTELILFVKLAEGSGGLISTAVAIGVLGVSMIIFAKAIEKMGSVDYKVLGKGLGAMAIALAEITIALKFMPKNMVSIGLGMLSMSVGLTFMAKALETMGGMSLWGIIKGLTSLGVSLLILVVGVNAMTGALAGAAALAIVTVALMGLAVALKMIGSMPLGDIVKSLLALVGVFTILGVASAVLSALLPTMLLLGGALIVLGVGLAAVGAAALVMSIGFGSLSVSGLVGVAVLLAITAALIPLTALTPNIVLVAGALAIFAVGILALGLGFSALSGGLALLVALGPSSFEVLVSLANTAAQISEFALQLLASGAGLLVFGAGALVAGAGALLAGAGIASLGAGLGVLAKVDLSNISGVSAIAVDLLGASLALRAASPGLLIGGAALVVFGSGAESTASGLQSITTNISKVMTVISQIPTQMDAACTAIVDALQAIMDEVKNAMKKRQPEIIDEVESMVDASVKAIKNKKNDYKLAGAYLVDGFIEGIKSKVSLAANSAAYMASQALKAAKARLDINSPSGEFEDVGMYADLGLAKGLKKYASVASQAATSVGEGAIRPVLDMNKSMASTRGSAMKSLQNMTRSAADFNPVVETRKTTTVRHTFDKLVVEGVNNKGEFVASADYAVEEVLANMMRRQSRI